MADPRILVIDASGASCGVALAVGERLLGETLLAGGRGGTTSLLPAAEALLQDASLLPGDIDLFGVTEGPGSFTGVRVGMATVKGVALALDKPVVTISSLALLALNLPGASIPVCPMFDARKKEVYAGLYRTTENFEVILPDAATPPQAFLAKLSGKTLFLGDGARAYEGLIRESLGEDAAFAPRHLDLPRPSSALPFIVSRFRQGRVLTPDRVNAAYLRLSEAEINRIKAL